MKPVSDQDRFWHWFENNNKRLQAAIYGEDRRAREMAIKELAGRVCKAAVNVVGLTFPQPSDKTLLGILAFKT